MSEQVDVISITADIVAAFVSNNSVRAAELPDLIASVHASLVGTGDPKDEDPAPELKPAVPIKKSVTPDYIISLEDGRKFKSLRRHLQTAFGMTPDDYRAKWGLPPDYPMVAPNYATKRSELARAAGLGSSRSDRSAALLNGTALNPVGEVEPTLAPAVEAAQSEPVVEAPLKRRPGRPRKAV